MGPSQQPTRRRSNARAVWITVSAVVGGIALFLIGLGTGAAGSTASDAAPTEQPTVTATATRTVTTTVTESVTATVTVTHRASASARRHVTHTSQPTATRHHRNRATPTRTRTRTSAPVQHGVHPGAFCTPHGAIGYTDDGTRMRCSKKAGDVGPNGPYWRWRSAG